jgi:hypothetical protein
MFAICSFGHFHFIWDLVLGICPNPFIRVYPWPKKFEGCRGALLRARTEFGVKGDKSLFLTLGSFLSVFICVYLCPDIKPLSCGAGALYLSVSQYDFFLID